MSSNKLSFSHLLGRKAKAAEEDEEEKARKAKSRQEEEDEQAEDRQDDENQDDEDKQGRKSKKAKKATDDDEEPDAEEDEGDTDGDDEDAEEEDDNKDVKKGRRAERQRCARIFSSPYATGRPDMAAHLAFNTPLSSAAAIHTLKMMGAVQSPATRVSLDSRMRAEQQVRIGADGHQPVSGSASAIATKMKQLYNVTKGKK
ncbi:MAG TPA: hypothetical protein ACHBZ9_09690 [Arsenophonus nasoniae]|uniref:hypothetical protein n=1 Tax=Arsenophonus nasoniae TaxID=638 RepID=UPI003879C94D